MATPQTAPAPDKDERLTVAYRAFGSDAEVKLSPSIIRRYLCKPTKKGVLPSDAEVMNYMMMCQARALNPFERDCFLVGYDGADGAEFSIITAIQAFTKRAEASPEFDGIESGVIVLTEDKQILDRVGDFYIPGEQVIGGWATVWKKNVRLPFKARLRSSVYAKNNKFWNDNPAGMIVKCAEADALRTAFPTKLGGLYHEGEITRERDVTPAAQRPTNLPGAERPGFLGDGSANVPMTMPTPARTQEPERQTVTRPEPEPEQQQRQPLQETEYDDSAERTSLLDKIEEARKSDGISTQTVRGWAHRNNLCESSRMALPSYPIESLRAIVDRWSEVKGGDQPEGGQ